MIEPLVTEHPVPSGIQYRLLTPDEILTLKPIFDSQGATLPAGHYIGAIEGHRIIGFIVLQLKLHAEPMWLERPEIFKSLVSATEQYILQQNGPTWVFLFAPEGRVADLAEASGMTKETQPIFYKLVTPSVPAKPFADLQPLPFDLQEFKRQFPPEELEKAYQSAMAGHDSPYALVTDPFDDSPMETIQ